MEKEIYVKDLVSDLVKLTVECIKDMKENGIESDKLNAVRENIRFLHSYNTGWSC